MTNENNLVTCYCFVMQITNPTPWTSLLSALRKWWSWMLAILSAQG